VWAAISNALVLIPGSRCYDDDYDYNSNNSDNKSDKFNVSKAKAVLRECCADWF